MGGLCNSLNNGVHYKPRLKIKNTEVLIDQNTLVKQGTLVKKGDLETLTNYKTISKLGEGTFAKVDKVLHIPTNQYRAMKKIDKKQQIFSEEEIKNEIDILKKLDHLNIVKIFEFYTTRDHYYLLTEFCTGGELFDHIIRRGPFKESQAAYIMYQILSAIYFCHSSNIIHRDLKPENILVQEVKDNNYLDIKIIDFGTAKLFDKTKSEKKRIGSSSYMAPEVILKNYTEKCDLWSCGVILYILLTKEQPFNGDSDEEIFDRIKHFKFDPKDSALIKNKVSSDAINLMSSLLEKNYEKRASAEKALKHNWFNIQKTKELLYSIAKQNIKSMLTKISNYNPAFRLQQVAVAFIVHNLAQNDEIRKIFSTFQMIDDNGDGRLSKKEVIKGLQIYNPNIVNPAQEAEKIFTNVDTDKNGFLEFEEFARVLIDKKKIITNEILKFAFDFFDKDGSGEITLEELSETFGELNHSKLKEIIEEIDINKDGFISFHEFKIMMIKILDQ